MKEKPIIKKWIEYTKECIICHYSATFNKGNNRVKIINRMSYILNIDETPEWAKQILLDENIVSY